MGLSSDQIKKVAKLANLPISDADTKRYSEQLSQILNYVEHLNSVNTTAIEPSYNVTGNTNVTRPDEVGKSLTRESATNNGKVQDELFKTKGVFNEE